MLEGLVASLLNRFLGMYIHNFDPKQLNVGIWSGDVALRDLELRREALDQLRLPINVVEGHVGLLTLSIPWSNLKGKPVKVFIEDVYLLAAPKEDAAYDEEEEAKRQQALKMERLESAELLKEGSGAGLSKEEQQKNQSFTDSLVTKIVNNLQISVKRIHVRYEDTLSSPEHPFALGLTLEEFSAVSTDDKWNAAFIQESGGLTHKLINLGALALYWNTDSALLGTGKGTQVGAESQGASHEEMIQQLRRFIVGTEISPAADRQFVLKPVNGRARVEMDKSGKLDRAKLKAMLTFEEIGVILDDDQYRDALMMIDLFHYFIRHQEFKKYQPKGVTPKEDPRAWLRFAGNAVLKNIHDRNRRWTWAYMKERRDDRRRYIKLFMKKKRGEALAPTEADKLEKLERKLTYEDLRFWRSLAWRDLRKEKANLEKPKEAKQGRGWGSWIWGSGKKQPEDKSEDSDVMTDEHRKELYNAIEWDEKSALAASVDVPREAIKLEAEASLQTGSFTLKQDPHGANTEALSLLFDDFGARLVQRTDSFLASVGLGGLRAYDGTTTGNHFPQIIKVKEARTSSDSKEIRAPNTAKKLSPGNESHMAKDDLFFELEFEQNPLDDSADSVVSIKMKSMEVVYNPYFVTGITQFFRPPERHMESIGALMETAGATVEGLRRQTRAGLEFALAEHKTINAKLDLQAPLIILPESVTVEKSICFILDAGRVRLKSELVDKASLRQIQSKQKQQLNKQDFQRLEGMMYDKFLLTLEDTQVLIGPSMEATRAQLEAKETTRDLHIIDRINMDFVLETSILPKNPSLTRFRVSGRLPILHLSVSDLKYKRLMKLIDAAVPNTSTDKQELEHRQSQTVGIGPRNDPSRKFGSAEVERLRSVPFQVSSEQELVFEEGDGRDKGTEGVHEDESNLEGKLLQLHQRTFEFKFTVGKLKGSLLKADAEDKGLEHLLVNVVAEGFELSFYLRPADMVAEVSLQSLVVEDHIEGELNTEFKEIISSSPGSINERKDLLYIKFVKVNRDSPELSTEYEGIETNIDISVSTITLIITRKTLLTLLDFVLVTFQGQNPGSGASNSVIEDEDESPVAKNTTAESSDQISKLRVKVNLNSFVSVLNGGGIKIATVTLMSAAMSILLVGKTMSFKARLGNLSLVDDINQGAVPTSSFRQLISIQGDELADFHYETFDPDSGSTYPGYSSSIFLRCGSIKINFMQEPFRKILEFFVRFGKMQAIFNSARRAAMDQANQIQEKADKTRFDIVVKTPIVVFPRSTGVNRQKQDVLTAYLGEIYANNAFVPLDDSENADIANNLSAGIRNIKLTSDFNYDENRSEELEMIDKVDLGFQITYMEHISGTERPDFEIQGNMSDIKLRLTQIQLRFLMELTKTVPAAFTVNTEDDPEEVSQQLSGSARESAETGLVRQNEESQAAVIHLEPELGVSPGQWTKVDLIFKVPTVALELLYASEEGPLQDADAASISKFSLDETSIKVRMISDGSMESELLIHSFTIRDSRTKDTNKFRKIMSSANRDVQQLMASLTISGGQERNLVAIVTMDSPRVILALDYVFAIQKYVIAGLTSDSGVPLTVESEAKAGLKLDSSSKASSKEVRRPRHPSAQVMEDRSRRPQEQSMTVSFRANIVDTQLILIANPTTAASEAIVLSTKQVLMSQQHALALQVSQVGIFLCRMDKFEGNRLRILDDFSVQMSMETRSQGQQASLTSVHLGIEPLILRLSLRDILLALQIVNKASELSSLNDEMQSTESKENSSRDSTSVKRQSSASHKGIRPGEHSSKKTSTSQQASKATPKADSAELTILQREEMTAEVEGVRVILIGDLHELPLLDMNIHDFNIGVTDWSGQMNADTNVELYVNVYNFSKSAWEPLIEPWQFGIHISREQSPEHLSVELYSRKMLELTLTSASIALASKSASFLSQEDDVLSKPRGIDAPYRIRNHTGFDISVWSDESIRDQKNLKDMEEGSEAPWRFEDWEKVRENLTPEGNRGVIGVKLQGSGFESVEHITVTREGETVYNLRPRQDNVVHRLLVEVSLGAENVKYVTLRSPLLIENKTQIPIEIGVFDVTAGHLLKIEKILPDDSRPAPVGAAFVHSLLVRPDQGFGYSWSSERLHWKGLVKKNTMGITCRPESGDKAASFFFQVCANYDRKNPLTG